MTDNSLTIIIPAYNVEDYLGAALDSIRDQIESPDELILIDDGSTDATLSVAESFNFSFPYKILSIENNGQGNARNIGTSLASTDYIYYFDSDDLLDKNFIKGIKQEISQNDYPDIILFSGQSFNDIEYQGDRWVEYKRGFSGYFTDRIEFLYESYKSNGLSCSPCLYITKRSFWGEEKLQFGKNYMEDEAVFFPLLFSCKSYCVLDVIYFYRRNRHGSTMTTSPSLKHVLGAADCIYVTQKLYSSQKILQRERRHIKKRLENQVISYIKIIGESDSKISYKIIFNSMLIIKDVRSLVKFIAYVFNFHEIELIRKMVRHFRK